MEGKFSEKDHHISRRNKPHGLQLKKKMEIKPSFRNDNVKRKSIRSALNDNYTKSYSRKKDAEKCVGDSRGKFANIDKIKGSSLNRGSSSKSLKTANISKSGLNYKTTLGDISAAKDRHTHGSKKSSISKSMKDKYNSERDIVQKPYKHFNRSSEKSDRKTSNSNNDSSFFKSDRKTLSPSLERGEAANPERHLSRSLEKTSQKSRKSTVSSDDDSILTDDRPRKIKRVMRIHPDDISNKRIDDSPPSVEKNVPKDVKPSLNAQFRAIKPNPELLSFVEDNLLGRRRMVDIRRAGYNVDLSVPLDNIPFSESSERSRIEDNVFRNKLTFFAAAKVSSSFPPADLPEIAFAGRSNVGKSSLLNALTRQWGVVRTSDKPGLTQTINFFNLGSKLCLVDLPGYGFAYAKEEVRDTWEELVQEYVSTRVGLKRVCLLIDTKWGIKPRDYDLINLMERSQTQYQIVLTKSDMVFPMDVARRATQIQENLKENKSVINPLMMVSSKSGAGIRSLRTVLTKLARFIKP